VAAHLVSDRLWTLFRENLGASYGVSARAVRLRDGAGFLEIRSDVENAKLGQALAGLKRSLEQLVATPPSPEALAWARYEEASGAVREQMTNEGLAGLVLERLLHGQPADPAELRKELAAVTAEGVQQDLKACFAANPTLSIVGDEAATKAAVEAGRW
jgi:predicted Zn-dependent peptidase